MNKMPEVLESDRVKKFRPGETHFKTSSVTGVWIIVETTGNQLALRDFSNEQIRLWLEKIHAVGYQTAEWDHAQQTCKAWLSYDWTT